MGKGRTNKAVDDSPKSPFHSPFAGLEGLRDALPEGERPAEPPGPTAPEPRGEAPARAVIRYQRKGRGGKEITRIDKLELAPDTLARWLKQLKAELGCGGAIEGEAITLQGDQRKRLPALLEQRGVRRISIS